MSRAGTFKLDRAGVRDLMRSEGMVNVLQQWANEIQSRCGEGYEVTTYPNGKTRANVSVHAATAEARRDNAENNTLLKARGGGI